MSLEILVTGGCGFIGSHLCETLLKRGDAVICADNLDGTVYSSEQKGERLRRLESSENFQFQHCDITNAQRINNLTGIKKPKLIVHLAALPGVRKSKELPEKYYKVNVQGTENVLLSAIGEKIPIIFASSSSVYGRNAQVPFKETSKLKASLSVYGQTKLEAEKLCEYYAKNFEMPITALRFFTVYGERGRPDMAPWIFTKKILSEETIIRYGNGNSTRDYTYVSDAVAGIISAIDNILKLPTAYRTYNIGGGSEISLNEFIQLISIITHKNPKFVQQPIREDDMPHTKADITKARKELNYTPTVSVEEGMKKFIAWYEHSYLKERINTNQEYAVEVM